MVLRTVDCYLARTSSVFYLSLLPRGLSPINNRAQGLKDGIIPYGAESSVLFWPPPLKAVGPAVLWLPVLDQGPQSWYIVVARLNSPCQGPTLPTTFTMGRGGSTMKSPVRRIYMERSTVAFRNNVFALGGFLLM